jgi:thymidylate synthase
MEYRQSDNVSLLIEALINFQKDFHEISLKKDKKNEHLRNAYMTLDNILNTIRPLLSKNGLVIVQSLTGSYLSSVLYHVSGQFIKTEMPFNPMSGNKGTNDLQNLGGGITYAKRYQICAMLSISADNDDDAQSSQISKKELTPKKKVESMDQVSKILEWIQKNPKNRDIVTDIYEISKTHLEYIDNELNYAG